MASPKGDPRVLTPGGHHARQLDLQALEEELCQKKYKRGPMPLFRKMEQQFLKGQLQEKSSSLASMSSS